MDKLKSVGAAALWCAAFAAAAFYQATHGHPLQFITGALLTLYALYDLITTARREPPPREYIVGIRFKPFLPAVLAIQWICILATAILSHPHVVEYWTVGRTSVLQHHEWYRLITGIFLHANVIHLMLNLSALVVLGGLYELQFGLKRFLIVFAVSALGGDLAVIAAGQENVLGASGAIYGFMGAGLYLGLRAKQSGFQRVARRMLMPTIGLLVLNLMMSFSIPNISIYAHVGGLLAGFMIAAAVGVPDSIMQLWALNDACPENASFAYVARTNGLFYAGPVSFALDKGLVTPKTPVMDAEGEWGFPSPLGDLEPNARIRYEIEDPDEVRSPSGTPAAASA